MATFLPSPLFGSISGSLGPLTFKLTRSGPVLSRRPTQPRYRSPKQRKSAARFHNLCLEWHALTPAQRLSWASFATHLPRVNALGIPRSLSGFQHFISHNTPAYTLSLPIISDPPPLTQLPSIRENTMFILGVKFTPIVPWHYYTPPHRWYPVVTSPIDPVYLIVQACFPQIKQAPPTLIDNTDPATWPFNNWQFLLSQSVSPGTPEIYYTAAFVALFGSPHIGDRFAFRSYIWHPTALRSAPYISLGRVVTP